MNPSDESIHETESIQAGREHLRTRLSGNLWLMVAGMACLVTHGVCQPIASGLQKDHSLSQWILASRSPAPTRNLAWPVGTGTLGALAYEARSPERIELFHSDLWNGVPMESLQRAPINAGMAGEINGWLAAGRMDEALAAARKTIDSDSATIATILSLADVYLDFPIMKEGRGFLRELDMRNGIARTIIRAEENWFERTVIYSPEHQMLGIRIHSETPRLLNGTVTLRSRSAGAKVGFTGEGYYYIQGKADPYFSLVGKKRHESRQSYDVRILPRILRDGRMIVTFKEIQFVDASEIILFISASTELDESDHLTRNPAAWNESQLARMRKTSWESMERDHSSQFSSMMDRFQFELDVRKNPGPMDPMAEVRQFQEENTTMFLPKLVQFARHTALTQSMGSSIPMNGSGVWGFHPRQNAGENPSLFGVLHELSCMQNSGVPEAMDGFIHWCRQALEAGKDLVRQLGSQNDQALVLAPGIDRWNSGFKHLGLNNSLWIMGGGWAGHLIRQNALITGNPDHFKLAHNITQASNQFFLDFFFTEGQTNWQHEGWLSVGPDTRWDPISSRMMNLQILLQSLKNQPAGNGTQRSPDSAALLRAQRLTESAVHQILDDPDFVPTAPAFWGVFPGDVQMENLTQAARTHLSHSMDRWTGDSHPVLWKLWSAAQAATLKLNDQVLPMLKNSVTPEFFGGNLLSPDPHLTTEVLSGVHGAVCRMFAHIGPDESIEILPVLPDEWSGGSIHGLRLSNGVELGITWKNGTLQNVSIHGIRPVKTRLAFQNQFSDWIQLDAGARLTLDRADFK